VIRQSQKLWIHSMEQKHSSFRQMMKVCSTDSSKEGYGYKMQKFMRFCVETKKVGDFENFEELLNYDIEQTSDILIQYIDWLRDNGNSFRTVRTALSPPEAFFEMNRRPFHKKVVRRSNAKEDTPKGGDVPATDEDCLAMLNYCKQFRNKSVIAFLSSTGMRPSGIVDPVLRLKHLIPLPDIEDKFESMSDNPKFKLNPNRKFKRYCYGVRVYDQSKEGYYAFLTPEASDLLDRYHSERKQNGEEFNDETPIFSPLTKKKTDEDGKEQFVYVSKNTTFDFFTDDAMDELLKKVVKGAKIPRKKIGKHYDKAITYMFRKRFNGILKMDNNVNSNIAEKLMAHKRGLDATYLQPTMEECYVEFFKAINKLTIDPHKRHDLEIAILENKNLLLKEEKERHSEEMRKMFIDMISDLPPNKLRKLMEKTKAIPLTN